MKGRVLGYDDVSKEGALRGSDGSRYAFHIGEWKSGGVPNIDTLVDFVVEGGNAVKIWPIKDTEASDNKMVIGVISLFITFFLGFIGTLISRLAFAKLPFSKILIPVVVHFVITLMAFIPVVGWVVYGIGTIYFMVKNYQLINSATT